MSRENQINFMLNWTCTTFKLIADAHYNKPKKLLNSNYQKKSITYNNIK